MPYSMQSFVYCDSRGVSAERIYITIKKTR